MIKRILLLTSITSTILLAQFNYQTSAITPAVKERMLKANSWRETCPVSLLNLRYINVNHLNFKGQTVSGEIIVHS